MQVNRPNHFICLCNVVVERRGMVQSEVDHQILMVARQNLKSFQYIIRDGESHATSMAFSFILLIWRYPHIPK